MWLKWLFLNKERKSAYQKLHSLDKKIPIIILKEENQGFEREKRELYSKLNTEPLKEIIDSIDELDSRVNRYVRIQQDKDYSSLIEHLVEKNINSETEIEEIYDPLDKKIVYKYLQVRKKEKLNDILKDIGEKLASVEKIMGRTLIVVSEKDDAEELRRYWNDILKEENDKLEYLKKGFLNLKIYEFDITNNEISDLSAKLVCLEKYGKDYLDENALEAFSYKVKDYMPREDITYEEIYKGLSDSIVTDLKSCSGTEKEGKMIKESVARLIYSRLKKEMFLR